MSGKTSSTEKVKMYIKENPVDTPIFTIDIYDTFPEIKRTTVRQILRRMNMNDEIRKASEGIYYKPNPNRILKQSSLSMQTIIEERYLLDGKKIIGYRTGLSFANFLGLTTQVANIIFIVSNNVSNKKRNVYIEEAKIIVNAPRTKVTSENYKILQVLDLMNEFESVSELNLEESKWILLKYLEDVEMSKEKLQRYMELYPLKAQNNFYKSEVYYEFIKRQGSI